MPKHFLKSNIYLFKSYSFIIAFINKKKNISYKKSNQTSNRFTLIFFPRNSQMRNATPLTNNFLERPMTTPNPSTTPTNLASSNIPVLKENFFFFLILTNLGKPYCPSNCIISHQTSKHFTRFEI